MLRPDRRIEAAPHGVLNPWASTNAHDLTAPATATKVPTMPRSPISRSIQVRNRLRLAASFLTRQEPSGAVPPAAYVEVTSRCNLECPMCARQLAGSDWEDRDMTFDDYSRILDSLGSRCELILPFGGGEPLLHPDIYRMVELCTETGHRCELATNATLLDGRAAQALLDAGLSTLIISLDAARAATYERIRVGGSYERTCINIRTLLRTKRRLGADTWVVIQMISLPENRGEEAELRRQWANVEGVSVVRVKADEVHVERIKGSGTAGHQRREPCHFPWLGPLLVRYDGAVFPCVHAWRDEPIGYLDRNRTLREIWNGKTMASWRKAHREGRWNEIPACRSCQAVEPLAALVMGSVLVPPHLTRRAIPLLESADRLLGHRLIRS